MITFFPHPLNRPDLIGLDCSISQNDRWASSPFLGRVAGPATKTPSYPAPSQIYSLCLWYPQSNQCPGPAEHSDYPHSVAGCWMGPSGNLGISPLLPCACPCQAPAAFPPFSPPRSQIMGLRVGTGTEVGGVRGEEAATILGTHLSALLCG